MGSSSARANLSFPQSGAVLAPRRPIGAATSTTTLGSSNSIQSQQPAVNRFSLTSKSLWLISSSAHFLFTILSQFLALNPVSEILSALSTDQWRIYHWTPDTPRGITLHCAYLQAATRTLIN